MTTVQFSTQLPGAVSALQCQMVTHIAGQRMANLLCINLNKGRQDNGRGIAPQRELADGGRHQARDALDISSSFLISMKRYDEPAYGPGCKAYNDGSALGVR